MVLAGKGNVGNKQSWHESLNALDGGEKDGHTRGDMVATDRISERG